jgi:disulfide oxidoreductase YuzD
MDYRIKIDKKVTKIAKLDHIISQEDIASCLIAPNDKDVISPLTIDLSSKYSPKRYKKVVKKKNPIPKSPTGSTGMIFQNRDL